MLGIRLPELIQEAINQSGLEALIEPNDIVQVATHIHTIRRPDDHEFSIGSSRMGGVPDLPAEFEWPEWYDGPVAFVGQLNLADFNSTILPASGLLYFFYDLFAWGGSINDRTRFRVLFFDGDLSTLVKSELPLEIEEHQTYFGCDIATTVIPTLPCIDSIPSANWKSTDNVSKQYDDLMNRIHSIFRENGTSTTWLLGNAHCYYGNMSESCRSIANQAYKDSDFSSNDEWILLLQVGTDEAGTGFVWGDMGTIFFWIRRADLAAGDFSKIWGMLECV